MPAQHRETRKNFIGIVNDPTEEERAVEAAARWQPHVMSYLVDRLTAALRRRTKGAWGPPSP